MSDGRYEVMAPVEGLTGKVIWTRVGTAWANPDAEKEGAHTLKISLMTLPIGAKAPLDLLVYPAREPQGPKP